MTAVPGRVEEGRRLVAEARSRGAVARLLGGVGVALRCPSAVTGSPLSRPYQDLDIVTSRRSASAMEQTLLDGGYESDREFNAAHGRTRMLFCGADGGHVDVFIGTFAMCHVLELDKRLELQAETLPPVDLLLTKLQIAQLNRKDVVDVVALLLDHDVTTDDTGINVDYLCEILCADWGWWRTVSENVTRTLEHLPSLGLDASAVDVVEQRAIRIVGEVERRPKTLRWRMRARVGDRVPWRDEPEEVDD